MGGGYVFLCVNLGCKNTNKTSARVEEVPSTKTTGPRS